MSISLNFEQYHCKKQNAPWVVLIHGLFGNLDNLAALRRHLTDAFNVIAIDLPDHGESPWVDTFTLADCVSALVRVLDDQHIDKCHVVGHSLGGKVAMLTALTHPDRVDKLVPMGRITLDFMILHNTTIPYLSRVL